ncbi:hypothetical protein [Streptomyces chrestomyceticus]|uniref:hypothetical protein n=1 Tax=Streptomyces chrestomyceticus TaxID=68185 RepID=UPI0037A44BC2
MKRTFIRPSATQEGATDTFVIHTKHLGGLHVRVSVVNDEHGGAYDKAFMEFDTPSDALSCINDLTEQLTSEGWQRVTPSRWRPDGGPLVPFDVLEPRLRERVEQEIDRRKIRPTDVLIISPTEVRLP